MRSLTGFLTAVALSLLLAGCADSTGPLPGADSIGPAPTGARRAARTSKTTSTDGSTPTTTTTTTSTALTPLRFASWAPRLETYDTAFVVIQGTASSDTLYFRKDQFGIRMPYMVINTPRDAQFVDASGIRLSKGSSVKLTVHADSQFIQLNFGPHGSTFSKNPATVQVSWFYIDLAGMSGSSLQLWYQPEVNTTWNPLTTQVDLQFYWLVSTLDHFSNYAVAYRK
jgi:hypothetical protein